MMRTSKTFYTSLVAFCKYIALYNWIRVHRSVMSALITAYITISWFLMLNAAIHRELRVRIHATKTAEEVVCANKEIMDYKR